MLFRSPQRSATETPASAGLKKTYRRSPILRTASAPSSTQRASCHATGQFPYPIRNYILRPLPAQREPPGFTRFDVTQIKRGPHRSDANPSQSPDKTTHESKLRGPARGALTVSECCSRMHSSGRTGTQTRTSSGTPLESPPGTAQSRCFPRSLHPQASDKCPANPR